MAPTATAGAASSPAAAAVGSTAPKAVLDAFWKLSESKDNVRKEAAQKIVQLAEVKRSKV